jgi:hypothetical protein
MNKVLIAIAISVPPYRIGSGTAMQAEYKTICKEVTDKALCPRRKYCNDLEVLFLCEAEDGYLYVNTCTAWDDNSCMRRENCLSENGCAEVSSLHSKNRGLAFLGIRTWLETLGKTELLRRVNEQLALGAI